MVFKHRYITFVGWQGLYHENTMPWLFIFSSNPGSRRLKSTPTSRDGSFEYMQRHSHSIGH